MHSLLARNDWLVHQHRRYIQCFYDLVDPLTGAILLESRELTRPNFLGRVFRRWMHGLSPFDVEIRTPQGELVVRFSRGRALTRSQVTVLDEHNVVIGGILHEGAILIHRFEVLGPNGHVLYRVKREGGMLPVYHFWSAATEVARVTKRWSGFMRMPRNLNNYVLEFTPHMTTHDPGRMLILAATICIDMVGGVT